jgi:hypothetical protein
MSRLFDGIINDGIFASIGSCLVVTAGSGNTVNVGTGKAWFNHTWTEVDAILPVDCGEPDILLDRIDAIVLEVNETEAVRDNFIKLITGAPSSKPSNPTLTNSNNIHQYALCYIYRTAGATSITQANITNMVGTDETPFITGLIQVVSLDELLGQWRTQLDEFVAKEKSDLNAFVMKEKSDLDLFITNKENEVDRFIDDQEAEYDEWYSGMVQLMADAVSEITTWTDNQKNTIIAWFNNMKGQLSSDAATNLQIQINEDKIERILMVGLAGGTTTFSDDWSVITTVDSTGKKLVKTFTNNFLTCTTILTDSNGGELGRLVKNFSSDGKTITSEITIF